VRVPIAKLLVPKGPAMRADVAAGDYHPPIVIDPNTGSIGWDVFNPLTGGAEMIFRRELSDGLLSLFD